MSADNLQRAGLSRSAAATTASRLGDTFDGLLETGHWRPTFGSQRAVVANAIGHEPPHARSPSSEPLNEVRSRIPMRPLGRSRKPCDRVLCRRASIRSRTIEALSDPGPRSHRVPSRPREGARPLGRGWRAEAGRMGSDAPGDIKLCVRISSPRSRLGDPRARASCGGTCLRNAVQHKQRRRWARALTGNPRRPADTGRFTNRVKG